MDADKAISVAYCRSTRDASEFGLDESRHEAFIKLMNLPLYQEGIAVE